MSTLNSLLIHDHGLGTVRKATADETIAAARVCVAHRMRRGASLSSPTAARDYLVLHFAALPHEVFCVIYLDSRHRVIECQDLFRGTIDSASVHPREVVKEALRQNAAACVFAHNHPSGVAEPSPVLRKNAIRPQRGSIRDEVRREWGGHGRNSPHHGGAEWLALGR